MRRFVGVGVCYLDTILTIPHFIEEDEKLRASSVLRRRGGNCANTLEVLQQLLDAQKDATQKEALCSLNLLTVLPNRSSQAVQEIARSLGPDVSINTCIFRDAYVEPASSYIIKNLETQSRTIISYNDLPDMGSDEFEEVAKTLGRDMASQTWYHFEGRIPDVTFNCIHYLRKFFPGTKISIELEKPRREGLQDLVPQADVIFYSKAWAIGNGYRNPEQCLRDQAKLASKALLLCCTWGEKGASALDRTTSTYYEKAAYVSSKDSIVDTVGAGDTFIAGMLYSCLVHDEDWSLDQKLEFSNELAGRKVVQEGFGGLAKRMESQL